MIQQSLADSLEEGECEAIGAWKGTDLVGIAAYAPGAREWHINVIATRIGHQNHHCATQLARHILDLAHEAGALVVTWFMHQDNAPMFALAKTLGGTVTRDPDDGSRMYFICTIPLA